MNTGRNMRIVYIIILALSISACSSIKQSSLKWSVIYPNPKDSAIIQVKGLYANKGKLLYNNASESNVDKQEFENDYLFKPTEKQIIALEKFAIQQELTNKAFYQNDTFRVIKKFRKYGRLYTGYICAGGDSVFVLNLIEKPGKIANYKTIAPPIMTEPWIKVPNRELWYIDLKKNSPADYPSKYSPCVSIKVQK